MINTVFGTFVNRHSLMATQLMTQLNSTFDLPLAVRELFSYTTIDSLANQSGKQIHQK